jgi:hypothetical protein
VLVTTQEIREPVLVGCQQFALIPFKSRSRSESRFPDDLVWAGEGGAVVKSGGTDHYADVRLQVWCEEPACDASRPSDLVEEGQFTTDVPTLVLGAAVCSTEHMIHAPRVCRCLSASDFSISAC